MSEFEANKQKERDAYVVEETFRAIGEYHHSLGEDWQVATGPTQSFIAEQFETYAPRMSLDLLNQAIIVGTYALEGVIHLYGEDARRLKLYSGDYEQDVPAPYHNGTHTKWFLRDGFRYMADSNRESSGTFSELDFVTHTIVAVSHDIGMGGGRGHDERRSSLFADMLPKRMGYAALAHDGNRVGVEATAWDDEAKKQNVQPRKGFVKTQITATVADLYAMEDERGPMMSVANVIEDMGKRKYDRVLTATATQERVVIEGTSLRDVAGFIQSHGPLRGTFDNLLGGAVRFAKNVEPSDKRIINRQARAENVDLLTGLHEGHKRGRLTTVDVVDAVLDYAGDNNRLC